jgi:hypothetical protein
VVIPAGGARKAPKVLVEDCYLALNLRIGDIAPATDSFAIVNDVDYNGDAINVTDSAGSGHLGFVALNPFLQNALIIVHLGPVGIQGPQ